MRVVKQAFRAVAIAVPLSVVLAAGSASAGAHLASAGSATAHPSSHRHHCDPDSGDQVDSLSKAFDVSGNKDRDHDCDVDDDDMDPGHHHRNTE